MRNTRRLWPAALVAVAFAATGCDPYDRLEWDVATGPTTDVVLSPSHIALVEGQAVGGVARPMDGGDLLKEDDYPLELSSGDETIFRVERSEEERQYVLWGVRPGDTFMFVVLSGSEEERIPVSVTRQGVLP